MTPEIDVDIFKDVLGRWRTESLFYETNKAEDKYPAIFTTAEEDRTAPNDGRTLTSMKRIYMEARDPTEYLAAQRIFGCWDAWEKLSNAFFFKNIIKEWRAELRIQIRSEAVTTISGMARGTVNANGTQLAAAKWLAEESWDKPPPANVNTKRVGRPTSEAVRRKAAIIAREDSEYGSETEEDYARISGSA